jgi:LPXTG-motif cell wall-anchored protein
MTPLWLTGLITAQTAQALPKTGNEAVDTLVYLGGALISLMGLREGTYWIGRVKDRRNGGGDVLERVAQIQRETLKELEEFRREDRQAHERIEDKLAELRHELRRGA